jgi:hypothetical protein
LGLSNIKKRPKMYINVNLLRKTSVAVPHQFDAAPTLAPGKNFNEGSGSIGSGSSASGFSGPGSGFYPTINQAKFSYTNFLIFMILIVIK